MFTQTIKWRAICLLFTVLCLLPMTSYSQDDDSDESPANSPTVQTNPNLPAVEQVLVPEGIFAKQLAEALQLGPQPDEAKAEAVLSRLGIEPKNGWITEYPVTPAVLGDIENGVSLASDQGKIMLKKDQALRLIAHVKVKLGFDVQPGPKAPASLGAKPTNMTIYMYTDAKGEVHLTDEFDSIPKKYQAKAKVIRKPHSVSSAGQQSEAEQTVDPQYLANMNSDDINDYYYDQGPPVVTYYSPPDPYAYLYSWIPYPFWSTGFYFPGFFVLNNFHKHVFFNQRPYFVSHHHGDRDGSRPFNAGITNPGFSGNSAPDRSAQTHWFSTPSAQAGARAIATFDQHHNRLLNAPALPRTEPSSQPSVSTAVNSRVLNHHPADLTGWTMQHNRELQPVPFSGDRTFNQPALTIHRVYEPNTISRFHFQPEIEREQGFRPFHRFEGGEAGGFHGGGNGMMARPSGPQGGGAARGGRR